jgi:hypothetical protein
MFEIKTTCLDLLEDLDTGKTTVEARTEYTDKKYNTIEEAIVGLNERIKDELERLNNDWSLNDFKVTYDDENCLAAIQCWEGRESEMTPEQLEGDRAYINIAEYEIIYRGCAVDGTLPDNWIN